MNLKTLMRAKTGARLMLAASALAVALPASAQTVLKVSHFLPAVHGIHKDFIEPWTKAVAECSGGEVAFEIFPGGTQLGNVAKQQEQLVAGVVDVAHGLVGLPRGRYPLTSIIELPFMVETANAGTRTLWSLYPDYLSKEFKGMKVLALHTHNGGLIHTRDKKVVDIKDLEGLRIRTPSPAISMMLEQLGAMPQGMPPGAVYESLQKGVIDGTVFPWDPVKSFGLAEVLKYHLDARAYVASFWFAMNQRKYDSLSEKTRACIDKYSGDALVAKFGDWWNAWDKPGYEAAVADGGVITEPTDEQRDAWKKALAPVDEAYLKQLVDNGADEATVHEVYKKMREKIAEFE